MPTEQPSEHGPFDFGRLKELMELMEKHGLTEVSLSRGDERWRLRRGGSPVPMPAAPTPAIPAPFVPPTPPAAAPPSAAPASAPKAEGLVIKSPTVGTFYASPSPDDPPFVTIGRRVEPDTIVCIIEAMKVFNQIPAEVGGTITEILVNNGDPVEYGQPLFRVNP